jgi:hypothetical protein
MKTSVARSLTSQLALLAGLVALALLFTPGARSGGNAITACDGATNACGVSSVTASGGVYFTVSTGGGNRDFASVAVNCDNGYSTVLTVEVPAKGTGSSQVIYPTAPASCTADLTKQMQIGKARVLGTVSFTVRWRSARRAASLPGGTAYMVKPWLRSPGDTPAVARQPRLDPQGQRRDATSRSCKASPAHSQSRLATTGRATLSCWEEGFPPPRACALARSGAWAFVAAACG